jgi:hypothetical protein
MKQGKNVRNFPALPPLETWHDIFKPICCLVFLLSYCRLCPWKFQFKSLDAVNNNEFLSISVRTLSHNYRAVESVKHT